MPELKPISHELLGEMRILLHGVPCSSSRGWLGYCSIVLFRIGGHWALYDTGHFSDRSQLLEVLRHVALDPREIRHIVVSHLHFDHILNIPLFKNASLFVSKAEVDYAGRVSAGEIDDPAVPENWQAILDDHEVRLIEGSLMLDDVTEVEILPGHTPGGLVVYRRSPRMVAVCGDVIKNAWDAVAGEPTAAGVDPSAAKQSIGHILNKAGTIIPGHDRPFCFHNGELRFLSPFDWQVRGNLLPGPRDEVMLDISLPEGGMENTPKL